MLAVASKAMHLNRVCETGFQLTIILDIPSDSSQDHAEGRFIMK